MTLSNKSKILINKKSIDMTISEWILYMNSPDIIEYNLSKIEFPYIKSFSNSKNYIFKDLFPTFSSFLKRLEKKFSKKWVKKFKILFKDFYLKNKNKIVKEYWIEKKLFIYIINKKYHRKITDTQLIFYIRKGYNLLESQCLKSKAHLKHSPMRVDFWIKRGYSEIEAKEKIRTMARNATKGSLEYYLLKGFDINKAKLFRKEFMNSLVSPTSYNYPKYNKLSKNKKKKIIGKIMKEKSPASYQYWINKGFNKKEARRKSKEFLWKINPMNKEKYILNGLTEEEAKKRIRLQSIYMSSYLKPIGGRYAKLFFENLEKELIKNKIKYKEIYYGYKNREYEIFIESSSSFYTMRKKKLFRFFYYS